MLEENTRKLQPPDPTRPLDDSGYTPITEIPSDEWIGISEQIAVADPLVRCVQPLIAEQAVRRPDTVAVRDAVSILTYAELDSRSDQLARHLNALGICAEKPVALVVERSVDMVVGMLGIWKAGGAYVPVSPKDPIARQQYILSDCQSSLVVTESKLANLSILTDRVAVLIDQLPSSTILPARKLAGCPCSDCLAYILYTSGSTGRPKGVQITHRSLVNLLTSMQTEIDFQTDDVFLAVTTLSFDIAGLEIWLPLISGGSVVIADRETARNGLLLSRFINEHRVTAAQGTPATWRMLLESGWRGSESLTILSGGEALPVDLARALRRNGKDVWNLYGPTETTIYSTAIRLDTDFAVVGLGAPVANTETYVLDDALNVVSVDEPGELYIGGEGLARGYLNRPDLTAEQFVPDPFSSTPGSRLYRTGDLVRRTVSGDLLFLGRRDHQVKIRGFRIETSEIEVALRSHENVLNAVVVSREDRAGDMRLVAYVVAPGATPRDLRDHLLERLPDYMIPTDYVLLPDLPLNTNGKVDRGALPEPEITAIVSVSDYEPPRTEIERLLARLLADVLGVERVGLNDSFFDLGGHSLKATRWLSRIRAELGVELPLRQVFETPRIAHLAGLVGELLCVQSPRPPRPAAPTSETLPRGAQGDRARLSFSQERLWFIDQLDPGSSAYNVPFAFHLCGELNREALRASLDQIVRRHESLRTRFVVIGDSPEQVVSKETPNVLDMIDLRESVNPNRHSLDLLFEHSNEPFDLSLGPLFRIELFILSADRYRLLVNVHHTIFDAWSQDVFVGELNALYAYHAHGSHFDLAEPTVQYRDYSHWQRQTWNVADPLRYWRTKLAGAPDRISFPGERSRLLEVDGKGATYGWTLPLDLASHARSFADRSDATLFMVLLAAWSVLLSRLSGQDDIVIGTPISGRTRSEFEGLIGLCIDTVVLRIDLSHNIPFARHLSQVRETCLEAYENRELPVEMLLDTLDPGRSLTRNPLFQVMFVLEQDVEVRLSLPGLDIEPISISGQSSKFDLALAIKQTDDGLRATFEYRSALFNPETVERMAVHFERLLSALTADPFTGIHDVAYLFPDEYPPLLAVPDDREWAHLSGRFLHEVVAEQAAVCPDAVAVVDGVRSLTYRQLNAKANRLAHWLCRQGVTCDLVVGLCIPRSSEFAVGVVGILKAGAAYMPMDPGYPAERLTYLLDDAGAEFVLTLSSLSGSIPRFDGRVVHLDSIWAETEAYPETNPNTFAHVDNLAYLLHTSGSTGKPKGVAMSHRALGNLIDFHVRTYPPSNAARTLQFASVSFDVCFQEMFTTWAAGGALVLVSDDVRWDAAALLRFVREHEITRAFLPVVVLLNLCSMAEFEVTGRLSLREIITAGEALQITDSVKRFFDRNPDCRLHNHYGPTESHVVTEFCMASGTAGWDALPSIGRPISCTRISILNSSLQPVAIGEPGEIHIAGVALARGYFNRPALTAEAFVPDPFSHEAGSRMYRTGDLARWAPDGTIDFIGRIDHQVKIRGVRIELGEIEATLRSHPEVEQAIAVFRDGEPGEKQLVVYVLASDVSPRACRLYLEDRLPSYMIPAAIVNLDRLPLTANGKVDRAALPGPTGQSLVTNDYVAPRTPVEAHLAVIIQSVLGVDRVGIYDNFFELGGHSLKAAQVVWRVRSAFVVDFQVRHIFQSPRVEGLARIFEELSRKDRCVSESLVLQARPVRAPLSFAQQRLWFLDHLQSGSSAYNISFAYSLHAVPDRETVLTCLRQIVTRHEILRTQFIVIDGEPIQRVSEDVQVILDVVDLKTTGVEADRLNALLADHSHRPFDLTAGPLIRTALFVISERYCVLHFNMHHIISDGWSSRVLMEEFRALYAASAAGTAPVLPDLPLQYIDYTLWQRQSIDWERDEAYWRAQLAGAPEQTSVPSDYPRPTRPNDQGAVVVCMLPSTVYTGALDLARQANATLFMVLLTAWNVLLARYSGHDDIIVGTPISGRTRPEFEPLIGLFVNTLVLRTRIPRQICFLQLLSKVRDTCLDAFDHQALPFDKLVEELAPARDLRHNPLFQVAFSLENEAENFLSLGGIHMVPMTVNSQTSKFDLTLMVQERGDCLTASFEYSTALFQEETISRLATHYGQLLEAFVTNPSMDVRDVSFLTIQERHQLLVEWNDTTRPYPSDRCVHELFEEQSERHPDAVAVVHCDCALTYAELNARANQLAHALRMRGVGPDSLVALCLDRSPMMVTALIGILKSGGAYVPIDTHHPRERKEFILQDTNARVLITQRSLWASPSENEIEIVYVNELEQELAAQDTRNPLVAVDARNLAYVTYTSGSTGVPKGVAIPHRAVCRLVKNSDYLSVDGDDVFAQVANPAFDATTFEVWAPLANGARIVVVDQDTLLDPLKFATCLADQHVTTLFLTTSYFNELVRRVPSALSPLNHVLFGGEKADPRCIVAARQNGLKQLSNVYGPTETTTFATRYATTRMAYDAMMAPIGRPISNTQVYVLDTFGQAVPVGVSGELYIGGPGLARGYWNRPDLTASSFVPNPFSGIPGDRLYRTGDLVRWRADGDIEFLGRIDGQVKLRGFRIELGDIESSLLLHDGVSESIVILRDDTPGDRKIAAYWVRAHGSSVTEMDLRNHLQSRLPSYMIPADFVETDSIPLTPNGKRDGAALPAPPVRVTPAAEFSSNAGPSELTRRLTVIVEDVLGRRPVGPTDDFFQIGGHSLLAIRLVYQVEREIGVRIPVARFVAEPTINQLVDYIVHSDERIREPAVIKLPSGDIGTPLFLLQAGFESVNRYYYPLARTLNLDNPFYLVTAFGGDVRQVPPKIEEIVSHQMDLIRSVQPKGPYSLTGFCVGAALAYECARQLRAAGETVERVILIDPPFFRPKFLLRRKLVEIVGAFLGRDAHGVRDLQRGLHKLANFIRQLRGNKYVADLETDSNFHLMLDYIWVLSGHKVSGYPGQVVVVIARDNAERMKRGLVRRWQTSADQVEIIMTDGNHDSCVREHLPALAEAIVGVLRG